MNTTLEDEVTSINSIYGDDTLQPTAENPQICILRLPSYAAVSIRLDFPDDYPNAPSSVLGTQSVGNDVAKGTGQHVVEIVRDVLAKVYRPGEPCVFDLIEEVGPELQQLEEFEQPRNDQLHRTHDVEQPTDPEQVIDELGDPPPWTLSEVITEKKSVFVARAAPVSSPTQAKSFLTHLLATDKKAARATHNITAWRIHGANGATYQDCDDDGEDAAGGRLLHLMQLMDVWDVMVVVTRWYGGIHLGPDRFRIINQVARDALVKGGFGKEGEKRDGKKKGKK